MKTDLVAITALYALLLCSHSVSAQTQRKKTAVPAYKQIHPKFSEMMDYGIPQKVRTYEAPDEKSAVINHVNADGSPGNRKAVGMVVPADTVNAKKIKKKDGKKAPLRDKGNAGNRQ